MAAKKFVLFVVFYSAIPGFVTAPVSMFLNINLSRIGKKNNLNMKLLYSVQNFSYFVSMIILGILCPIMINKQDLRPLQLNTVFDPSNQAATSSVFMKVVLISAGPLHQLLSDHG